MKLTNVAMNRLRRGATIAAVLIAAAAGPSDGAELRTIAVVCHCRTDFPTYRAFEARLADLGWRDGETGRIVRRFRDGDPGAPCALVEQVRRLALPLA